MRLPQLQTADLYDDRFTAQLQALRLLVDHTVRRLFAKNFGTHGSVSRQQILGPTLARMETDLRAITRANLRRALLEYLVVTDHLISDGGEQVLIAPSLDIAPAEEGQARTLIASDARFAAVAEWLDLLEGSAEKLLQGEDATRVLGEKLGYAGLQAMWERQALTMPQRTIERTLAARTLLDRMRRQESKVTVLEAGAGIGAVLRRALELPEFIERLPSLERYIYTDISRFLIEGAREWFQRHAPTQLTDRMEFRVLDLDSLQSAPLAEAGAIDLVLLDDVAHDVIDLHATLTGLRGVLRENGWLAFTEHFRQPPRDFLHLEIFPMTLHSYNKARLDPGRRSTHGFLTLAEWRAALVGAGFTQLQVYPQPEHQNRWPVGGFVAAR